MTVSSGGAEASSLTSTVRPGGSDDIAMVLASDSRREESAMSAWCGSVPKG
jgi:hypothetical protein